MAAEQISVNINAVYDWLKRGLITAVHQKNQNVTHPVIMFILNEVSEFKESIRCQKIGRKTKNTT